MNVCLQFGLSIIAGCGLMLNMACHSNAKESEYVKLPDKPGMEIIHEVNVQDSIAGTDAVEHSPPDPEIMALGRKVYDTYCTACHMADGKGVPGMNPPLRITEWVNGDKNRLIRIILQGLNEPIEINGITYYDDMTAHAFLSDTEVAAVLTFVRNSFGNRSSAIRESEVAAVRSLR